MEEQGQSGAEDTGSQTGVVGLWITGPGTHARNSNLGNTHIHILVEKLFKQEFFFKTFKVLKFLSPLVENLRTEC